MWMHDGLVPGSFFLSITRGVRTLVRGSLGVYPNVPHFFRQLSVSVPSSLESLLADTSLGDTCLIFNHRLSQ